MWGEVKTDEEISERERAARKAQNAPEWPTPRVPPPRACASDAVDWAAADSLVIPHECLALLETYEQLPGDIRLQCRTTQCWTDTYEELARAEEACDTTGKERAMKMLECMTEMILGKYRSRGNRGRGRCAD